MDDMKGNSLSKGDQVILMTCDKEFLNTEDGQLAERGDAFEVIRHLGKSEGYDEDSNSILFRHLATGEEQSYFGFRVLLVNSPSHEEEEQWYVPDGLWIPLDK